MKKIFLFMAALWMAAAGTVKAANEIYAVKTASGDDVVMTLYYDDQRISQGGETDWSVWKNVITKVTFDASMEDARPTSTKSWFAYFSKLKEVENSKYLNTSQVTDMTMMFYECSSLTELNLTSFNTANVTIMNYMFEGCSSMKTLNLLWFETTKAGSTRGMFRNCSSLTTIYCNTNWWSGGALGTAEKFNYGIMFEGCTALKGGNGTTCNGTDNIDILYARPDGVGGNKGYFTHKDVSAKIYAVLEPDGKTMTFYYDGKIEARHGKHYAWGIWEDVVTKAVFHESCKDFKPVYLSGLFYDFLKLETIENLNYLNTEMSTSLSNMFKGCKALTSVDVSSFDTKNATTMEGMFMDCEALTTLDVSNFNTEKVLTMNDMFYGCEALTTLDVSNFNTEDVTDMRRMFYNCNALTSLDVSNFKTEKVTTMEGMFYGCSALTSLDLSHFNTENVTNMETMFYGCNALTSLNISNFKTEKVTTMWGMFFYCKALTSLDVSHFKTENVKTMGSMFGFCETLTALDVSNFNTGKVTIMSNMFRGCSSIKELDVSNFDISSLTSTDFMFEGCTALKTIWCDSEWSNSSLLTNSTNMFDGCSSLQGGRGTRYYDSSSKDKKYARPDAFAHGGYFSATGEPEIYALLDGITMFILYDNTRWMNVGMYPCANDWWKNDDFWSHAGKGKGDVTKVIFDESVKKAKPTSTAQWFQDFLKLETIEHLDYLNTEEVREMTTMFSCCHLLKTLDLSHFKTNKVKSMNFMFYYCEGLESLDLSSFKTDSLQQMCMMFQLCSGLETLDLSSFNVDSVTNCMYIFSDCTALKSVNLEGWTLSEKAWAPTMFYGCSSLETIYCSGTWHGHGDGMFAGCTKLKGCLGTAYDAEHTGVVYAHPDGGTKNPGYFTGTFKVTLQAEHGKIGVQENVDLNKVTPGTTLHLDVTATDEGYEFDKWENYSPALGLNVISDTTVTAIFKAKMFTVRFLDWDQTPLKQESVAYGSSATPPADPTREGYTFTGWDTDEWQNVKRDLQVYATYKKAEQGLESIQNSEVRSQKILRDGQMYILRGEKLYDARGELIMDK